jgi:SpoVK/Ycf46/Vps4 family AAA+-type ATPase
MARADQIKALIRRHAAGDDRGFYAVAIQMAAQAARQGHTSFAQELRKLIDEARDKASAAPPRGKLLPLAQPRGDLVGLLDLTYPKTRLTDLALAPDTSDRLARIVLEQRQSERLRARDLLPTRHVLFVGPPGTGKTMTADALAGELSLPLFTIRLDGLITKFMGETASKLRLVFEAIAQTRGVYLFDEVDALAGERALANDVGEIRRVLNSFLQFLERDPSDSLILAATNHPRLLDRAIFRRFDAVLTFELPDRDQARDLIEAKLATFDASQLDFDRVLAEAQGLSQGEISRACEQAAKTTVLTNRDSIETETLLSALNERRRAQLGDARSRDAGSS